MSSPIKTLFVLIFGSWCSLAAVQQSAFAQVDEAAEPVRIADLGLDGQIPSAIDLIGPEGSAAGRNRAALSHRIQCWIDSIEPCTFADRNDPRVRAIRQFLGLGPEDRDGEVLIHFPDRTRIAVRLVRAENPGPDAMMESVYAPVVLPDTAQAPGLAQVPSQPQLLEELAFDGATEIRAALDRLMERFEMPAAPVYSMPVAQF